MSSFANIPLFAFQISSLKINSAWNSSTDGRELIMVHLIAIMTWYFSMLVSRMNSGWVCECYIADGQQFGHGLQKSFTCMSLDFSVFSGACHWTSDLCFEVEAGTDFVACYQFGTSNSVDPLVPEDSVQFKCIPASILLSGMRFSFNIMFESWLLLKNQSINFDPHPLLKHRP